MSQYDLDALGWYQFEQLCQSLLRAVHGAKLETWGGQGDWGRDAYSEGPLNFPSPEEPSEGPFLFQVKHVSCANAAGAKPGPALQNAVAAEARAIKKRKQSSNWKPPKIYFLMTNVTLSPDMRQDIRNRLSAVLPDCDVFSAGGTELDAMLNGYPAVRLAFPQILGLRDLESLIATAVSKSVRERSRFALEEAKDLSAVFVAARMYDRALSVLARYGFAVLTGPPEMGKTAIALMISLARFTDNWEIIDCRHPDDFFKMIDRKARQLFIADDAFGQTEYRPELAAEWAKDLGRILSAVDKEHGLIWTSRPAPLREGLKRLDFQGRSRSFPDPAKVEIDVNHLSIAEKAQILYRHAKSADLSEAALLLVRQNAHLIVWNSHFTPLRIQRFVNEQLPRLVEIPLVERGRAIKEAIEDGLQRPTRSMSTSFLALDEEHKSILFALLESGPRANPTVVLESAERILGRPLRSYQSDLIEDVRDHFIRVQSFQRPAPYG